MNSHRPVLITAKPALVKAAGHKTASVPRSQVPAWKRQLTFLSRWLHVYLSMASFAVLFFFAVTGLTLNHAGWFSKQQKTFQYKGRVPQDWVNTSNPKEVAKLEVVEHLRRTHGIRSALTDFRVDASQLSVSFKGPGYTADAFVDRQTGVYDVTESRMGLAAILNDLHKGRDSGPAWSALIDVSAILMCLVSLTGMVLIFILKRSRLSGLMAAAAGAALCYLVYLAWVPR
jgi:hypothetical protein